MESPRAPYLSPPRSRPRGDSDPAGADPRARRRRARRPLRWLRDTASGAVAGAIEHDILTQAAALAFYSALSLAPILVLMIWGAGSLGFDAQNDVVAEIRNLLGLQAAAAVELVIENADDRPDIGRLAGWLSLGALLFSATAVFAQLQQSMNRIWGVVATPSRSFVSWLRKRLLSLGLVISLGFVLLVSMVVGAAVSALSSWLESRLPFLSAAWPVVDFVLPFLVYVATFMLVTRVLPDRRLGWRDVFLASLAIAALFTIGKYVVGLYLATRAAESAYGAAGSLMAVLLWSYYSSTIVLFGTELAAAAVRISERRIDPETHAASDSRR